MLMGTGQEVGRRSGGRNKNRLCLREIIGLVFSATESARSQRTYSDKFQEKQSRKGHVIFCSFYLPDHINSSANSLKECISANQQSTQAHTEAYIQSRAYFQPASGVSKHLSLPLSAQPSMAQCMAAVWSCGSGTIHETIHRHKQVIHTHNHTHSSRHGDTLLATTMLWALARTSSLCQ